MARLTRRSFLGGLVAALTGWLGGKRPTRAAAAAAPTLALSRDPTTRGESLPLLTTTSTYDGCRRLVSFAQSSTSYHWRGSFTTYTYDIRSRSDPRQPPSWPGSAGEPPAP